MMMITGHRPGQEEAREQLLRLWRAVEQLIKEGKVIVTIVIVTTAVDIMASQQIRIYNFWGEMTVKPLLNLESSGRKQNIQDM